MAFGFQSGAFQSPGFQQSGGGARPAGGGYDNTGYEELFIRPVKIGRDTVKVDDERELIEIVAEKIVEDAEVEWSGNHLVFDEQPKIDWAAVHRLRAQSERLNQEIVLEAIRRVVDAVRQADDERSLEDEAAAEEMLLSHGRAEIDSLVELVREQTSRYQAARAANPPRPPEPVQEPVVEPPAPPDNLAELARSVRELVAMMAAPREVVRDSKGRAVGVVAHPDVANSPVTIEEALSAIRQGIEALAAPRELVRDAKTTRLIGVRTIQ